MEKRRWIGARKVRERYNEISEMTLWRWIRDPNLGFPQPAKIAGRRYFDEADLDRYDEQLKSGGADARAA